MNEDEKRTTQGWSFFCAVRASRRGGAKMFRAGRRGAVLPAAAKLFLLASGGPISFSSERNGGKNAAKNPWVLDFLPLLDGVC